SATEYGARFDGLRVVDVEILPHDIGLGVRETDVKMTLEGDQHAAHLGVGCIGRVKRRAEGTVCGRGPGGEGRNLEQITSLHGDCVPACEVDYRTGQCSLWPLAASNWVDAEWSRGDRRGD